MFYTSKQNVPENRCQSLKQALLPLTAQLNAKLHLVSLSLDKIQNKSNVYFVSWIPSPGFIYLV